MEDSSVKAEESESGEKVARRRVGGGGARRGGGGGGLRTERTIGLSITRVGASALGRLEQTPLPIARGITDRFLRVLEGILVYHNLIFLVQIGC